MTWRRALGFLVVAACLATVVALLLRRKTRTTHKEISVMATAHDTPANVERTLGEPLERVVRGIPGVAHTEVRSNAEGASLSLALRDDADLESTAAALTLALGNAAPTLPAGARPTIRPSAISNVVHYIVTGDALDRVALRKVEEGTVGPALAGLPGVSSVEGCGGSDERIAIDLDPTRVTAFGIDPVSLVATLRARLPVSKLEDIASLPVGTQRVSDVAVVGRAPSPPPCLAFGPLGPLVVGVMSVDGGDTNRVAQALAAVPVPAGVKLVPFDFRTVSQLTAHVQLAGAPAPAELAELAQRIAKAVAAVPVVLDVVVLHSAAARIGIDLTVHVALRPDTAPGDARQRVEQTLAETMPASGSTMEGDDLSLVRVLGPDLAVVSRAASDLRDALRGTEGVRATLVLDARQDPLLHVDVDRLAAADLGVNKVDVAGLVELASGGIPIGTLDGEAVVLRMPASDPLALGDLRVRGTGGMIPLRQVLKFSELAESTSLVRYDGQRSVAVEMEREHTVPQSTIVAAVGKKLQLPMGVSLAWPQR